MIETALSHGWKYLKECTCSRPGSIYKKGRNKLTIYHNGIDFKLVRMGNSITTGKKENLEHILATYGL